MVGDLSLKNDNINGSIEISCDGFDKDCVGIPTSKNFDDVFTLHSRSETYNLGIKPDSMVQFISKVMSASDECEKALTEVTDILRVRTQEKIKTVESKIQAIHHKLEKQSAMLLENRKCDIENEQNALKERLDHLKLLEVNDTVLHKGKQKKQSLK